MQYHHYNPGSHSSISSQTPPQNRQIQDNMSIHALPHNQQSHNNISSQTPPQNRQIQDNHSESSNQNFASNPRTFQNVRSKDNASINRNQPINQGSDKPSHGPVRQQESAQRSQSAKKIRLKSFSSLLNSFLPSSLYDAQSKKIFGFLTAEDLLLIALIILYAERDSDDNSIMVMILVYLLVSEYIDLPDFSF